MQQIILFSSIIVCMVFGFAALSKDNETPLYELKAQIRQWLTKKGCSYLCKPFALACYPCTAGQLAYWGYALYSSPKIAYNYLFIVGMFVFFFAVLFYAKKHYKIAFLLLISIISCIFAVLSICNGSTQIIVTICSVGLTYIVELYMPKSKPTTIDL